MFKRKKYETVELSDSFGITRFGYFTPLLVAIQRGHAPIVSFIMEKMKLGVR